jgi:hypothetical protein
MEEMEKRRARQNAANGARLESKVEGELVGGKLEKPGGRIKAKIIYAGAEAKTTGDAKQGAGTISASAEAGLINHNMQSSSPSTAGEVKMSAMTVEASASAQVSPQGGEAKVGAEAKFVSLEGAFSVSIRSTTIELRAGLCILCIGAHANAKLTPGEVKAGAGVATGTLGASGAVSIKVGDVKIPVATVKDKM